MYSFCHYAKLINNFPAMSDILSTNTNNTAFGSKLVALFKCFSIHRPHNEFAHKPTNRPKGGMVNSVAPPFRGYLRPQGTTFDERSFVLVKYMFQGHSLRSLHCREVWQFKDGCDMKLSEPPEWVAKSFFKVKCVLLSEQALQNFKSYRYSTLFR